MIIRHRNQDPAVDISSFVAPTAALIGAVNVGPRSRVMYGAVLDSEGSRVEVGECTVVCENAVLRATKTEAVEHPVRVADHVMLGPHATLLGCDVQRTAYIATGATILQGARIGVGAVVAVGALVHAGTVLPDGYFVPPNMIALGDPVEIRSLDDPAGLTEAVKEVGFLKIAFGLDIGWEAQSARYEHAMELRSAEFEAHRSDVLLR
ncbi:MAG: acyltransferase [Actinomycetota bacterium]|nr:acyltransferase [Actinomycetota bacterium]